MISSTRFITRADALRVATEVQARVALRGPAEARRIATSLRSDLNGRSFAERRAVASALHSVRPARGPVAACISLVIDDVLTF